MSNLSEETRQKYRQALENLFNGQSGFAIIYNASMKRSDNVLIQIPPDLMAKIVVDILYQISGDKSKIEMAVAQEEFKNFLNKFIEVNN